jgi:hypothetical protein
MDEVRNTHEALLITKKCRPLANWSRLRTRPKSSRHPCRSDDYRRRCNSIDRRSRGVKIGAAIVLDPHVVEGATIEPARLSSTAIPALATRTSRGSGDRLDSPLEKLRRSSLKGEIRSFGIMEGSVRQILRRSHTRRRSIAFLFLSFSATMCDLT